MTGIRSLPPDRNSRTFQLCGVPRAHLVQCRSAHAVLLARRDSGMVCFAFRYDTVDPTLLCVPSDRIAVPRLWNVSVSPGAPILICHQGTVCVTSHASHDAGLTVPHRVLLFLNERGGLNLLYGISHLLNRFAYGNGSYSAILTKNANGVVTNDIDAGTYTVVARRPPASE
jgi:hypothetical protein